MGTFYNRQDASASCSPVTVGDEFQYDFKNCRVTKLHPFSFEYKYVNPSYSNSKGMFITYRFWQDYSYKNRLGKLILKGQYVPMWNTPEKKAERKLKRLVEKLQRSIK